MYVNHRTVKNFRDIIKRHNTLIEKELPNKEEKQYFLSSVNSYLGMMSQYKTYTLRKKILMTLCASWWKLAQATVNFQKLKFSF